MARPSLSLFPRLSALAVLAASAGAQVCGLGQTLLIHDNLPAIPPAAAAVSVIQGLCDGEAAGAVFDVTAIGPQVRVRGAAIGFMNAFGIPGITAAVDLELFDGISWSGGIPTLGPSLFRWSTVTGSNLQVTSSGLNTVTLPPTVNVTATSGTLVCAWWMVFNTGGNCVTGYQTNFATDNAAPPGFSCNPAITPPQKNLIFILGQGWRDAATATVGGIPLCPFFYSGNWLVRVCVEPAGCPAPLTLGAGTPGTGSIVPTLATSGGPAQVGNSGFGLAIGSGRGAAPALLVLNAVETPIPFAGGTIFVVPGVPLATALSGAPGAPGAGASTIGIPIPPNPVLVGGTVTAQAGIFDPVASSGVALTPGLRLTICM